ncbi:MAG TPA: sulfatase-like hydrolase/transferase [Candidatus Latescibacteria bacterium]|nr:sulfatase-like hydrolase/transferase [Candidatus Latescibacterota bacterium]
MVGRPNILLIMTDEHAPMYSSTYGHPLVQTPSMDQLADEGATFDNAYCNSPLCLPSRMSFMTGRYIHRIGAYDNASPLPSDTVTWAHMLRAVGYDVTLSGKQHFCGPDQLHGFHTQLARDLHAEMWTKDGMLRGTADWSKGTPPAAKPWGGVAAAGPGTTTEIEVDDLVEERAIEYLRDPARKDQPWALNASFIAPHFPLVVPERYFNLYPLDQIDVPEIPEGHLENQHPVHQRMRSMFGAVDFPAEQVRRARAGYYGLITYLDEKIGRLLQVLEETGQRENTVVVHFSDHGEMNGEHGMWRKSSMYEASSRVPLQIRWPGRIEGGQRIGGAVSLVDLVATVVDVAGAQSVVPLDGNSLMGLMQGRSGGWKDEVFCEYLAHGVQRPTAMLRTGRYKFNYSLGDAPELYDITADPNEFNDLAASAEHASIVTRLQQRLLSQWNPVAIETDVLRSQQERLLIERAGI